MTGKQAEVLARRRSECWLDAAYTTQMRLETSTSGNTRHRAIQVANKICLWKVQSLVGICWSHRNANAFRGGLIALDGDTADRNQDIGLRIVCGSAPAGNRIWDDRKAGCLAHLSFKVTVYIHDLTGLEISSFHIKRVQEEHPATTKDTTIAVIQSIDRGIELVRNSLGAVLCLPSNQRPPGRPVQR